MNLHDVKHIEQYFHPWAMYPRHFDALYACALNGDIAAHIAESKAAKAEIPIGQRPKPTDYETQGDTAIVNVTGTMTKHGTSFNQAMPFGTRGLAKAIGAAAANKDIKGIVLQFETGGGSTLGQTDFVDAIAAAKKKKPVIAYVDDFCCSAGYWAASQCDSIIANRGAEVGSIGTYMVVQDASEQFAMEGIKTHVIHAGEWKGAGVPGTEITESHLANFQREVEEVNALFMAGVSAGRGMSADQVSALADGRIHIAANAKRMGLIDKVGTINDAINAVRSAVSKRSAGTVSANKEAKAMNDEQHVAESTPRPATYSEIKVACPGADAEFIGSQCEANATVPQAQSAWMTVQSRRIEENKAALAAAEARIVDAEAKINTRAAVGVDAVGESRIGASDVPGKGKAKHADPVAEFNGRVNALMAQGMQRSKAFATVCKQDPALREQFVDAHNAVHNPDPKARRAAFAAN